MPHTKSAAKRMRTSGENRLANRASKSRVALARRQFLDAAAGGDKTKSEALYRAYSSELDKAVQKGALKANNANRHKSRADARLKKI